MLKFKIIHKHGINSTSEIVLMINHRNIMNWVIQTQLSAVAELKFIEHLFQKEQNISRNNTKLFKSYYIC